MPEPARRLGDVERTDRSTLGRWMTDLPLLSKTRLIVLLMFGLFFASSAAFLWVQSEGRAAREWTVHTYEVLSIVDRLDSTVLNARRILRDGVLAADPRRIADYQAERVKLDADVAELHQLTHDNPVQQSRLLQLDLRLEQWTSGYILPSIELLQNPEVLRQKLEDAGFLKSLADTSSGLPEVQAVLRDLTLEERRLLGIRSAALQFSNRLGFIAMLGVALVGLLSAFYALRVTRRVIAEPLSELTQLIPQISAGGFKDKIPHGWRRDEVGQFARALTALATLVERSRAEDWIKTHLARFTGQLQLADSHESFGDALLRSLCPSVGAAYGVAYRWNEDRGELQACASYGLPIVNLDSLRFQPGQGMVGECLREARLLSLSPVPAAHFQVVSGLGSALPETLSFAPLVWRGEPVGVIELASLRSIDGDAAELLSASLEPAALAWQTLARSLNTRELLAVTRTQAEELQTSEEALRIQQEELQTSNEALRSRSLMLEEQGNRLQASEEELRAQAEELRLANDALREKTQALGARQEQLEAARGVLEAHSAELEKASRYKSEFLANMSHELRTPLNSLLILSKALADNEEGNLLPDQVESARIVHDAGGSLLQLINDILDLSKIEAGRTQLVIEDVSLRAFAAHQERHFRHVANSRNLEFVVELQPGLPDTMRSDGTRLGQIVVNLLSNAFKFTEKGRVTLSIGRPTELGLPGLDANAAIAFSVTDSGIGIPEDRLDAIFQPFEQVDSGTSRRFGGTGLGLSIVRGLAGLLGGEVRVRSQADVGSTFILTVPQILEVADPVAPPASIVAPRPMPPAPMPQAPSVIVQSSPDTTFAAPSFAGMPPVLLVVEDDPAFAAILAGLVARKNIAVRIATTGAEAMQVARTQPLLGVLLDIGLPDVSGWRVLEALKAEPHTRAVPVHIISAADDIERGLALGAIGFLTKPVTREAVSQALERVLERSGASSHRRQVLLVDDDAGSRAAVRKLLVSEAADIYEVGDARSASEALLTQHFDCIVLDLGLPDVSGFELLDELAARGPLPPVVVYSGRELTEDENLRLRQYTDSIVIKGVRSPERLLDEVSLFLHALKPGSNPALGLPMIEPQKDIVGRHVLIVDDDMRNIFALSKALRSRKLQVTMAQDGYKALAQLEDNPQIDLVLMDIMMPGMDGYETMRRIRAQAGFKNLPIIAVTAKAMTGDREKCLEAGANDYCSKPIDIDKLMSQLRVWL